MHPAGGVLLPARPEPRRPGALDAGHRHRHRQAGQGGAGRQRRRAADRTPDQGRRHHVVHRGRDRLPAATASRTAPYNLFMDLTEAGRKVEGQGHASTSYLPFGSAQGPAAGPAGHAGWPRRSPAGTPRTGRYAGGKYTNQNSYAAAGDQFRPDNVLVLRVRVGDAGYTDPAGNPVPGDEVHRQRPGDALPRRPGGARHLEEVAGLDDLAAHQGRRAAGAGRAHLGRAGAAERRQRHRHQVAGAQDSSSRLVPVVRHVGARSAGPADRGAGLGHRPQAGEDVARSRPRPRRWPGAGPRRSTPRPRRPTWRRRRPG